MYGDRKQGPDTSTLYNTLFWHVDALMIFSYRLTVSIVNHVDGLAERSQMFSQEDTSFDFDGYSSLAPMGSELRWGREGKPVYYPLVI